MKNLKNCPFIENAETQKKEKPDGFGEMYYGDCFNCW